MRKFIKQLFLFITLAVICLNTFEYFLPYHYGNKNYTSKLSYLESNESKFNTLFFGSSLTDYSIYPPIIDSILSDQNIVSFNFGVGGTSNPESYYLTKKFIEQIDSSKFKNIILEISPIRNMSLINFKTTRNSYYHSTKQLSFSLSSIYEEDYPLRYKSKLAFKYSLHYLKNKINFSKLVYFRDPYLNVKKIENEHYNGFTSTTIHNASIFTSKDYTERRNLAKTLENIDTSKPFSIHSNRLLEIYKLCEKKGIKLFFLIQPKLSDYTFMNNIIGKLPNESIINVASVTKYPSFYDEENSLDPGHLNSKGAIIFSTVVANELKKRLHLKGKSSVK